jgi:surfactin synthase thioesterase subunit
MTRTEDYLPFPVDTAAPVRLFCFHHAGGAASVFTGWVGQLNPYAAVVPVQLPGRERRIREPRVLDMDELVTRLDRHLDAELRTPYALYGHSMGALIAFRLAERRAARGARGPLALLAGAASAPHQPSSAAVLAEARDDELAAWMGEIGGLSPMMREHPQWLDMALRLTRDDLRLYASDTAAAAGLVGEPLDCPIHVFAGDDDPVVPPTAADGWARHTRAGSLVHAVPGGHFFVRDHWTSFRTRLRLVLNGATRPTGPFAATASAAGGWTSR